MGRRTMLVVFQATNGNHILCMTNCNLRTEGDMYLD